MPPIKPPVTATVPPNIAQPAPPYHYNFNLSITVKTGDVQDYVMQSDARLILLPIIYFLSFLGDKTEMIINKIITNPK